MLFFFGKFPWFLRLLNFDPDEVCRTFPRKGEDLIRDVSNIKWIKKWRCHSVAWRCAIRFASNFDDQNHGRNVTFGTWEEGTPGSSSAISADWGCLINIDLIHWYWMLLDITGYTYYLYIIDIGWYWIYQIYNDFLSRYFRQTHT